MTKTGSFIDVVMTYLQKLSNKSTMIDRQQFLREALALFDDMSKPLEQIIYEIVDSSGYTFIDHDENFTRICRHANDIEACKTPLRNNRHALGLLDKLRAEIEEYLKI